MYGYIPFEHLGTSLSAAGVLTVTNSANIGNFEPFTLRLKENLTSSITGAPVLYQATINGAAVYLKSAFGTYIPTNRLRARVNYCGRYIVPETGDPYIVLLNVPVASTDTALAPASGVATADDDGE